MNSLSLAQTRYTCKVYEPTATISAETLQRLLEVLRLAPSALNIQPWQFIIAQSAEAKEKIAQATQGIHYHNAPKILDSAVTIVFAIKTHLDEQHLTTVLQQEAADGRFATPEAQQKRHQHCLSYIQQKSPQDIQGWSRQQLYIALGALLLAAPIEQIDATPIEGFDPVHLDQLLGLDTQGLNSVVLVTLGHRHIDDFNAKLPKSRLPANQLFTTL